MTWRRASCPDQCSIRDAHYLLHPLGKLWLYHVFPRQRQVVFQILQVGHDSTRVVVPPWPGVGSHQLFPLQGPVYPGEGGRQDQSRCGRPVTTRGNDRVPYLLLASSYPVMGTARWEPGQCFVCMYSICISCNQNTILLITCNVVLRNLDLMKFPCLFIVKEPFLQVVAKRYCWSSQQMDSVCGNSFKDWSPCMAALPWFYAYQGRICVSETTVAPLSVTSVMMLKPLFICSSVVLWASSFCGS